MLLDLLLALLLAMLLSSLAACALQYDEVWRVEGRGGFSAPNYLADPETGRPVGIVVCEGSVGLVRFDLQGKRVWEVPLAPPCRVTPAVADVDGDGREEIVAADSQGNVVLVSGDGRVQWRVPAAGGVVPESCPAIADVDGDGAPEILVGDLGGAVTCLDRAGQVRWRFTGDEGTMGPLLVADLYDAPGKETIVTSLDQHIYALSGRGEWLWDIHRGDEVFPNTHPALADVAGDGRPDIYIGGGLHHFLRVDPAQHKVVFEENVHLHVNTALAAADLDGDGKEEVVFGNKGGAVWCYGQGGFRWRAELPRHSLWTPPVLADLNGDGKLEILWLPLGGGLDVVDAGGGTLLSSDLRAGSSPLLGDFDGDGLAELIATAPPPPLGNSVLALGKLGVPFHADPRNRLRFGVDRANTGQAAGAREYRRVSLPARVSAAGQASVAMVGNSRLHSGPNTWRFDVANPHDRRLALLIEIGAPDGSVQRFARHVRNRRERVAVSFTLARPGTYAVSRQLVDADTLQVLASERESLDFAGFAGDQAYLADVFTATARAIDAWRPGNPTRGGDAAAALASLQGTLARLQQEEDGPARVAAAASLIAAAERLRSLVLAGRALVPAGAFGAWEASPWAYFDARETLPTPEQPAPCLRAELCIGEYESLALNLTSFSGRPLEVRVRCEGLAGPAGPLPGIPLEFRRAVAVATEYRERVADALPRLDEAGLLPLPALESAQLWITVNAVGLPAGRYTATLRLSSVEPDPTELEVPVEITVHPLALPRPRPLRFCLWTAHAGTVSTANPQVLQDLVEHGATVFLAPSPTAACDGQGNLVGALDFTAHDEVVRQVSPHGFVMFIGSQSALQGVELFSEAWRKAYVTYLRAWVAHMQELGLGYNRWALYPYDEPSTPYAPTTQNLVKVAQVIREADPRILIYADPTSGTTMETVRMLTGLLDIWCPSAELLERLGDELVPEAKRVGKEVWFYDASGHAKTLSTLGLYRWRSWYAWNKGFTGAGWWTYHYAAQDPWPGLPDSFDTVYTAPGGGVVSSKRWEAAREGVEDYEYLWLLRQAIAAAEQRGQKGPALVAAKRLLADLPREIEPALRNTGRSLPLTTDSVPAYDAATDLLRTARRRLIEAVLALQPV